MNVKLLEGYKRQPSIFDRLSIQQRLPLFILLLLLTVVTAFSSISYYEVKKSSLAMGTERVTTLADKLTSIFQQSINHFAGAAKIIASEKSVVAYLDSRNKQDSVQALGFLERFGKKDTANKLIQLLNVEKQPVLSWSVGHVALKPAIDISNAAPLGAKGYVAVGKIVQVKGLMYFPAVASIKTNNKVIGYVVNWKILRATQESVDQLGQLLGGNGKVYFGNDDNSFWTNLLKPVPKPPLDFKRLQHTSQYSRDDGNPLIGSMRPLKNSRWLVLVELSSASMLQGTHTFLIWVIIIGSVLVLLGGFGGWLLSRSITNPLRQLSQAASSIADGNYSLTVDYNKQDELGKLATSFNIMAAKIQSSQQNLEQKVEDKTKALEAAQTDIKYQEENVKRKDEFISIASHELKTPLTTIKAFFQIAEQEITPESKSFNLIPRASRQVKRMEHLISDLLDVSKINLKKIQYKHVVFDIGQVIQEAVNNIQEVSPRHKLIIMNPLSVKTYGDANRIEQAISNLLDNAVKFSPEGGKVVISCELKGNMLTFTITDFGIGIAEDTIDALFEKFFRADTNHQFQGLGLGLFISSEIIKEHGGTISVKSQIGEGSAFTVRLPVMMFN